jgi:hypothetical protein
MSSNTLEIIQGLAQAAANSYDGAHDERYSHDGVARTAGLQREAGDPIHDKRVMDGFSVSFYGNKMCIKYQSDIFLREVYANDFESEMERRLNEVKKFLEREYRAITGKSVSLTSEGEAKVLVQSTSRVRSFVQAYQHYKVSGIEEMPKLEPAIERSRDVTRKFLDQFSDKRPSNDTRKKES